MLRGERTRSAYPTEYVSGRVSRKWRRNAPAVATCRGCIRRAVHLRHFIGLGSHAGRLRCQTRRMKAVEVITNLHTDDVERAREFFAFLGLSENGMNQGWVARFTSPDSGASVQVVTRDATAPEDSVVTIKVDDVDRAYAEAKRRGYEIVHPITDEAWGIRRFFVRSPDGHVINVARHRE